MKLLKRLLANRFILITECKNNKFYLQYSNNWGLTFQYIRKYNHIHGKDHQYWYNAHWDTQWEIEQAREYFDSYERVKSHKKYQNGLARQHNDEVLNQGS